MVCAQFSLIKLQFYYEYFCLYIYIKKFFQYTNSNKIREHAWFDVSLPPFVYHFYAGVFSTLSMNPVLYLKKGVKNLLKDMVLYKLQMSYITGTSCVHESFSFVQNHFAHLQKVTCSFPSTEPHDIQRGYIPCYTTFSHS